MPARHQVGDKMPPPAPVWRSGASHSPSQSKMKQSTLSTKHFLSSSVARRAAATRELSGDTCSCYPPTQHRDFASYPKCLRCAAPLLAALQIVILCLTGFTPLKQLPSCLFACWNCLPASIADTAGLQLHLQNAMWQTPVDDCNCGKYRKALE